MFLSLNVCVKSGILEEMACRPRDFRFSQSLGQGSVLDKPQALTRKMCYSGACGRMGKREETRLKLSPGFVYEFGHLLVQHL